MPDDEFGILWQRRLRNQLDDRSASEIERVLEIRVRSLERRERVLGQRSVDGTTTPAFLALENDGFDTPILRLVGRATDAEFLRDVSQRVEARLDEVEERIVRRNASRHGTVVWVPHPDRTHSDVYRLIRGGFDDSFTSEEVHWIAGLPSDERRFQEVASVGVLVDSVAEATARVERAGGTVVVQSSHETGLYAVVADPANELVLLWEPPATAVPLAVQGWARCVTGQVLSVAEFYRAVVGWNTAVIRGGPPMGGVWLRGDEPIGALFEDRSLGERSRLG
jgi:predicted enzyme related to lactoylglutathione lyase